MWATACESSEQQPYSVLYVCVCVLGGGEFMSDLMCEDAELNLTAATDLHLGVKREARPLL